MLNGAYPADVLEDLAGPIRDVVVDGDLATIAAPLDWMGVNYYHDLVLAPGTDPRRPGRTRTRGRRSWSPTPRSSPTWAGR